MRKVVKKTYFNAVSFSKGVINKIKSGEKVSLKKAKRVVESMVDLILEEEGLLVGMTAKGLRRVHVPPLGERQHTLDRPRPEAGAAERGPEGTRTRGIISEDQGLTTRILKLANSPLYGFPAKIDTASHAVTVLGTQQISDLVLASSLMRLFKGIPKELIDMDSFWCHSISCGLVARTIATYRREPNVERFFAAGIIHDVGRLIMYTKLPAESHEVLTKAAAGEGPLYAEERSSFGFDHAAVGGALMNTWKLPRSLEEMVAYHHAPSQAKQFPVDVAIVHVADLVTHAMQLGSSGSRLLPIIGFYQPPS